MANSTFVILEHIEGNKKSISKPTDLDMSHVLLLERDGDIIKSPKGFAESPRSGSPRLSDSSQLKRSPRLERALQAPSPPRREEEFKDIKKHDEVTRRKSSGSFSISIKKIFPVAPPNSPENLDSPEKRENENTDSYKKINM